MKQLLNEKHSKEYEVFKLRLGAFIPRSVGWSVGLSVLQKLQKFIKLYKTLQGL